jgi:hypothetical protein
VGNGSEWVKMGPYPFQAIPLKRDLWEAMDLPWEGPLVLRDPPALRLVMHGGVQHVTMHGEQQ